MDRAGNCLTSKGILEKKRRTGPIYAVLICAAAILLLPGVLNTNLWFDESYTTALMRQPLERMLQSATADVHPLLYYFMLRGVTSVFGTSIFVCRLFSAVPILLLVLFGMKWIGAEFGEKTGYLFSLVLLLLPTTYRYGSQIRMYSWALFFVTVAAFCTYRCLKRGRRRDWLSLTFFSLAAAYTHYFALLAVGVLHLILLLVSHKRGRIPRLFWITAGVEFVGYLPGFFLFASQSLRVAEGYWITLSFPEVLMETLAFFFWDAGAGPLSGIFAAIGFLTGLGAVVYLVARLHRRRENEVAVLSLTVIGAVLFFSLAVSLIRPIYIPRYLLPMSGLFSFSLAWVLAREKRRVTALLFAVLVVVGAANGVRFALLCHTPQNGAFQVFLNERLEPNDLLAYESIRISGVMAETFPDTDQLFYNRNGWNMEIYTAFDPPMRCSEKLESALERDRVWVVDSGESDLRDDFLQRGYQVEIDRKTFFHPYSGETFSISLLVKS